MYKDEIMNTEVKAEVVVRAEWQRPQLRKLDAREAEAAGAVNPDFAVTS